MSSPEYLRWGELLIDDWRRKEIYFRGFLGLIQGTVCNDKDYVKDFWDDIEFCQKLRIQLDSDLRKVSKSCYFVVAAFHCIPFKEGLIRNNLKPNVCYNNAFTGSRTLGDTISKYQKVGLCLWGHVHHRQNFARGTVRCANVSFDPQAHNNPVILEI